MGANGSWTSEREVAVQAARAAGKILLERFGVAKVRMKGLNDPVTEADIAAQEEIERIVRRRFPADGFVGEESAIQKVSVGGRRWIVDPLDGTINYTHGFPFFAVSIAFECNGNVKVGAIFDPLHNELFLAMRGFGATCNGQKLRVSSVGTLSDAMIVAGLPSDLAAQPNALPMFDCVTRHCQSIRRLGSAALALAYLSAGRLDGFYSTQVRSWDVAAGAVLVEEAGGTIADLNGGTLNLNDCTNIIATNGLCQSELTRLLAGAGEGKRIYR